MDAICDVLVSWYYKSNWIHSFKLFEAVKKYTILGFQYFRYYLDRKYIVDIFACNTCGHSPIALFINAWIFGSVIPGSDDLSRCRHGPARQMRHALTADKARQVAVGFCKTTFCIYIHTYVGNRNSWKRRWCQRTHIVSFK